MTETPASQPTKNGAVLYAMVLPDDFRERIEILANDRRCIPADVLLEYAIQGERCQKQRHDEKVRP